MIPNYTHERIPRRAECLQWDGNNTDEILGFLAKNSIIGELYRGNEYILIKQDGCIATSIRHGIWILKGEDGVVRYYSDSQHKLMYRPIDDELERLRAFARDILNLECPAFQSWQKKCVAGKHGITVDILKVPE